MEIHIHIHIHIYIHTHAPTSRHTHTQTFPCVYSSSTYSERALVHLKCSAHTEREPTNIHTHTDIFTHRYPQGTKHKAESTEPTIHQAPRTHTESTHIDTHICTYMKHTRKALTHTH